MNIENMIEKLDEKDNKIVYENVLDLESISIKNNEVYNYFNKFIQMLDSDKTYIRVRGFRLICINAKWDNENKINGIISKLLIQLDDEKPTSVRQYLKYIEYVISYKQELILKIKEKVLKINYFKYNESMQELIKKDIDNVLKLIEKKEKE